MWLTFIETNFSSIFQDFFCMLFVGELRKWGSISHHLAAIVGFHCCIVYGKFAVFALIRLSTEFSTPFINNLWFLTTSNRKNTRLFVYNSYMILFAFTVCRIVPIVPFWNRIYNLIGSYEWNQLTNIEIIIFSISNIPIDVLNLYWYSKIIQASFKYINTDYSKNFTKLREMYYKTS
jgi:hypothetical protein